MEIVADVVIARVFQLREARHKPLHGTLKTAEYPMSQFIPGRAATPYPRSEKSNAIPLAQLATLSVMLGGAARSVEFDLAV